MAREKNQNKPQETVFTKLTTGIVISTELVYLDALDWLAGALIYTNSNVETLLQTKWLLKAILHSDHYLLLAEIKQHAL